MGIEPGRAADHLRENEYAKFSNLFVPGSDGHGRPNTGGNRNAALSRRVIASKRQSHPDDAWAYAGGTATWKLRARNER